ncbi:MAG: hypothetical protein WC860_07945 [Candidatus Margulisiibacteriota bacterium]|jgi:hypothetical protein
MRKILDLIAKKKFSIVISLPKNDLALAKAAFESKIDALKVHLNVEHKASGTFFGSWQQEKEVIAQIIDAANVPIGLMPGTLSQMITSQELNEAKELGIDFVDCYDYDTPLWLYQTKITKMIALGKDFTFKDLRSLNDLNIDLIEASIIKPENYGQELTVKDIELYQSIVKSAKLPVFIPSQKKIKPEHLKVLKQIGVKGVLLGVISLGNTVDSFRENIEKFVDAI